MLATNEGIVQDSRSADGLERRIALLKTIRAKTMGLVVLSQMFSEDLADSFATPRSKIDLALAALLLERELRADQ